MFVFIVGQAEAVLLEGVKYLTLFKKLNCPGDFHRWCPWQQASFSRVPSWGLWVSQKGRDWGLVLGGPDGRLSAHLLCVGRGWAEAGDRKSVV